MKKIKLPNSRKTIQFEYIKPIDNSEISERNAINSLSQDRMLIETNARFKYGGDNMCVTCTGMCENIVPIDPYGGEYTALFEMVGESNLNIIPNASELDCAFTEDGFFIVYNDVLIGEEVSLLLGLPISSYVQSGIYTAYYDEVLEAYTSVVVNIG